jgi:hypothetical protein
MIELGKDMTAGLTIGLGKTADPFSPLTNAINGISGGSSPLLASGGGGVAGGHVVVNVNAPVYGVNDMESVVVRAINLAQRRGRL